MREAHKQHNNKFPLFIREANSYSELLLFNRSSRFHSFRKTFRKSDKAKRHE